MTSEENETIVRDDELGLIDGRFAIPSMQRVEEVDCDLTAISTFSGCGGSSLGYRMAGFDVVWANEFVDIAADTYELNHSGIVSRSDIRNLTAADVLRETSLRAGDLDLLDGSPPCASFSTSGTRDKSWGQVKRYSETEQRVDDLFFEFARIVEGVRPKTFVAENVKGLVQGRAKGYFLDILSHLKSIGYVVEARLMNASYLGVPQRRPRLFFIGVREDLGQKPVFPTPHRRKVAIQDVFPYVLEVKHGSKPYNWQKANTPSPTIMQSDHARKETAYLSGGGWIKVQEGSKVVKRKWRIDELKTICTFPQDFELIGSFEQQWERMGRAVPPFVSRAIGMQLRTILT